MKIVLEGVPRSTNHIYKFFRSRMYMTAEGRALKRSYQLQAKLQFGNKSIITNPLALKIILFFNDKRKRDIDNYNKILLDSMSGIVYEDDVQIQTLTIAKQYDKKQPRIEITIDETAEGIKLH